KGTPCLSSWKPGASPTNIKSAFGSPDPKTTCVRPPASAHFVQPATTSPKACSSSALVRPGTDALSAASGICGAGLRPAGAVAGEGPSVTAATTPAAATAATTESAGLPGGADRRERRQLPGDLRPATVRAGNFLVAPDELLEVLL